MNPWQAAVLCLTCLMAGCRTDPAITALERENRELEDEKYELEYDLEKAEAALESCRRENSTLKKRVEETGTSGRSRPPASLAPSSPRTGSSAEKPAELRPPVIELPSQSLPPGQIPETFKIAPKVRPNSAPFDLRGLEPPEPSDKEELRLPGPPGSPKSARRGRRSDANVRLASAVLPRADNASVQKITLNRFLTGGCNMDRQPGDEGVVIVIEPRDAEGNLLPAPAPVSIVLLDGALQGEAARLARWDFTAAEIAATYRKTPLMQGFYLELPWSSAAPSHSRLQLYARYTTDDGRKLESHRQIDVALYGQPTQRWSPAQDVAPPAQAAKPAESEPREASRPQRPVWAPFRP